LLIREKIFSPIKRGDNLKDIISITRCIKNNTDNTAHFNFNGNFQGKFITYIKVNGNYKTDKDIMTRLINWEILTDDKGFNYVKAIVKTYKYLTKEN
jgi:chitinase